MLERATGCLENGGLRLLRLTSKPHRPRRSLHSAFWCHGAGDIDLPSWWISLLQQPPPEKATRSQSIADTARKCLSAGLMEGGFLDFLYPAKTLTLIHKLAVRDVNNLSQRTHRSPTQAAIRTYTSDASDERVAVESDEDHAMNLVATIQQNSASQSGQGPMSLIRDGETLSRTQYDHAKAEFDQAWQGYEKLESSREIREETLTSELHHVGKVSDKMRIETSRQILSVFTAVPIQARTENYYDWAMTASLDLNNLRQARRIHSEALKLGHDTMQSTVKLLRYIVRHERLEAGTRLLAAFEERYPQRINDINIFTDYNEIDPRHLTDRIRKIGEKVIRSERRKDESTINYGLIRYAVQLILQSLSREATVDFLKGNPISFKILLFLIKLSPKHSTSAIWHLFLSKNDALERLAFKLYEAVHSLANVVQPADLMERLIKYSASVHDDYHLRMIFEDYRKHHGLPAPELFSLVFTELSRQGDGAAFHALLQEYRRHFGDPKDPKMYQQLLHVHSRRMELKEVITNFDSLQTVYGFVPNVDCWNTVIAAHTRLSDIPGALKWYKKMLENNINPDANTFSTLTTMYAPGGDVDAIENLLQECKERRLKLSTSMIDSLVLANIKAGDHEEAEKIVSDALMMDLVGSRTHMWNYILNSAALQRDLEHLTYLHQCMEEADIPSDALTYSALMQGLCVQGTPQSAEKILYSVMPQRGLRATAFHFAVVMGGLLYAKKYDRVFLTYRSMLKKDIRPNFSTNILLVKAATYLDAEEHTAHGRSDAINYRRATELLSLTLKITDPMDISLPEPLKGIGPHRLDEAFISSYFEYLIYLEARSGSIGKVQDLYEQYLSTSQQLRPGTSPDPPIKMLASLMLAHVNLGQHDDVEKCWYLALQKAEPLALRAGASLAEPGWVLPARRLLLNLPLTHYMKSLTLQNRVDDIADVLKDLLRAGYRLSNKSWNLYVQYLARSNRANAAFRVAEVELMDNWWGWRVRGRQNPREKVDGKDSVPSNVRNAIRPEQRVVHFNTFAALAEAYRAMRSRYALAGTVDGPLQRIHREAPRAVKAVVDMPRRPDGMRRTGLL